MAAHCLTLLGGFELRSAQGDRLRLPTRKCEALLAVLALDSPRPLAREGLAALLWSGADAASARASLRQSLSLLGKALGDAAPRAQGRHLLLDEGAIEVDALRVEQVALAEDADADTLARAAALVRGELLAGHALAEPAFDDWLQARRARQHELALRVLTRLPAALASAGRHEDALQAALSLVSMDPLHEAGHRGVMQAYARLGRRAAALRHYQVCVGVLQRELGTEPEAATRALYHELLRHRGDAEPGAPSAQGPILVQPVHESPLVARQAELQRLRDALHAARAGQGSVLTLQGEAGLGKTRLAEELSAQAAQAGLRVLAGRCLESQQLFPFAPWVEALRRAEVSKDEALLTDLGPAWRTELAALLPEATDETAPASAEASATARQARLFEAVIQVLARLVRRQPVLLVLEDLHWGDTPSLQLLATLARRGGDWPLLVLATLRDEELAGLPRLQQVLRDLAAAGPGAMRWTRLPLQPLTHGETSALVHALQRSTPAAAADEALLQRVWTLSEGNPLVVVEALRALPRDAAAWQGAGLSLPERVRELILDQVQRVGAQARRLLEVAAVAGRETDFALLQRAGAVGAQGAAAALEELVRRRLLCLVGESFDFSHARVRQAVLDALLPPRRRALHLALAHALEARPLPDPDSHDAQLAYHYDHTEQHAKALHHLVRHAQRAAHGGAHAQALDLLAKAQAHAARLPAATAASERRELLLRQARSLFFLGRFAEVLALLVPARAAIDAAHDPRISATYFLRLGSTRTYLGDHPGAVADAERALAEARACGDRATMGKAHFLLSLERFWDQPLQGVRHGRQAVAQLQRVGETWWTGQACWILGLNLSYRGRFAEGLAMEARAAQLAEQTSDRRLASYAAWTTGFIHTLAGELEPALAACRRSVALALDPLNRMTSLGILSLALVEHGDLDEALQALQEAVAQAVQFRIPQMHGLFLAFRAEAERLQGRREPALASAGQSVVVTQAAGYRYGLGWAQRVHARVLRDAGDLPAAIGQLRRAVATFDDMGAPFETARTRLELAGWLAQQGRDGAAQRLQASAWRALDALGLGRGREARAGGRPGAAP
ncbi:MAG: AAA family ATPase [Rubrivivax sp.]